jgi:hypothetical protein
MASGWLESPNVYSAGGVTRPRDEIGRRSKTQRAAMPRRRRLQRTIFSPLSDDLATAHIARRACSRKKSGYRWHGARMGRFGLNLQCGTCGQSMDLVAPAVELAERRPFG